MHKHRHKISKAVTVTIAIATVVTALYIMFNGLGLAEGLDFGAGAYYYADIPEFDKYVNNEAYDSRLPLWLAIVLFLAWGALMYLLWTWIDGRGKKD